MMVNLKWVIFFETALLVLLLAFVVLPLKPPTSKFDDNKLVSASVSCGSLEPKSFLTFNFNPLKNYLSTLIAENNIDISLYVQNLRGGNNFDINMNSGVYPASLNKIPIAVLIVDKIERGELTYETPIKINKNLLGVESDSVYFEKDELTVRFLLEKMLKESDNDAFHILAEKVDIDRLNDLMTYYDVDATHSYDYNFGISLKNYTLLTPKMLSNMFLSLFFSTVLEEKDSEYLLGILTNTTVDMNTIAELPTNVTVSHKWGAYYEGDHTFFNDCGIMYSGSGRILFCMAVRDRSVTDSVAIAGKIVKSIYLFSAREGNEFASLKG